jgi:hypothetical protein
MNEELTNSRSEKQELRQNNVGRNKARTAKRMDIRTKDDNSAVHTFARENTQGATDVHPNADISGNTKMLLHQPQLKQMVRVPKNWDPGI